MLMLLSVTVLGVWADGASTFDGGDGSAKNPSWGAVLLIIFYVENLDVESWGVKNDV